MRSDNSQGSHEEWTDHESSPPGCRLNKDALPHCTGMGKGERKLRRPRSGAWAFTGVGTAAEQPSVARAAKRKRTTNANSSDARASTQVSLDGKDPAVRDPSLVALLTFFWQPIANSIGSCLAGDAGVRPRADCRKLCRALGLALYIPRLARQRCLRVALQNRRDASHRR
jgi:hypothetical protein